MKEPILVEGKINIPITPPSKWKDKVVGVFASFFTSLLLLTTNAMLKGLNLDIADALFVQSVVQVIVFIIMVYIKRRSLWIWTVDEDKSINNIRLMLILGAVLGTISRVTDIVAIKYMPLGDAMTIILSQSIPTAILAAIVFNDRFRLIKISCLILVVNGVTLVVRPHFQLNTDWHKSWPELA